MEATHGGSESVGLPGRRPRVLIVDDDPGIRLVCATTLSLDGYEVIEAANGQEALKLVLTQAPDVVLLDISMPVLDGFGVAAALRADERTRALPFVFLTGELDPTVTKRGHEVGAAGFFPKPFDAGAVVAFLGRLIGELTHAEATVSTSGHAA